MPIFGRNVILFCEDVGEVVVHFEAMGAFGVITVEVYARKAGAGPVLHYFVVFLEDIM